MPAMKLELMDYSGILEYQSEHVLNTVLQIASKANRKIFDEIKKEDRNMYSALVELMQPEIDEAVDKRVGKAVSEAVEKTRSETWDVQTVRCISAACQKCGGKQIEVYS